ncbi:Dol-P-Man:Man(5)GlcNAc(2)-PP-Dol alpha-1,3-mannosyltransferase [Hypsizygus marmoreus]|uniref:Dol-P-Man:Man(5)GlcNAc(2)-PP-Dol alpha-1,3-mannosyltransferase n=1 Tax=Hypsizygus marmoreus TaxID=39966 RepID=A0A369JLK0_HYPMA|nr:Dol-P-Man:Man(5)GlcNAc(2)-PP-Dol alpha-1,3-mannosyltransferase [Hypsizygus marmoreus]
MVKHLPPPIKHLLTLRNPNVLPGPSVSRLHSLFTRTSHDAKLKKAETGWLVLTTCTLLTANRPASLGHLYRFVTRSNSNEAGSRDNVAYAANKAALMRESALKSAIFVGVPRKGLDRISQVILSLAALHEALDDDVKQTLRTQSHRAATSGNIEATIMRGQALWNSIYAPHADKLHDKLGSYHPDFISFIIQSYGSVLSPLPGATKTYSDATSLDDPDQGNLSQALGSVVGIATLRAEGRVGPQLVSHTFGLLKARYVEGQSKEDAWLSGDEGTEWVLRTVDEILDVISSESQEDEVKVKL